MTDSAPNRRIPIGELIAFAALIVSAFGAWITWKASNNNQPTRVVEQKQPIPLTLRGRVDDGGRSLEIGPVESSHALDSLTLTVSGSTIQVGSDGRLGASELESAIKGGADDKGRHSIPVQVEVRYVEMGKERSAAGRYVLRYEVEGGGLLGGRSLKLRGFSRA
ncbi:MAG: hypothetical protein ACJ8D6_06345 [Sphingomicrobium sp.]